MKALSSKSRATVTKATSKSGFELTPLLPAIGTKRSIFEVIHNISSSIININKRR
jgi:hypothetical protein